MKRQRGFTLIELMIVVTIIALLAAIAIPEYQTYAIKSKVTEGLSLAAAAQTAVVESFQTNGTAVIAAGPNLNGAWVSPQSKYVQGIVIDTAGNITVTFQPNLIDGTAYTIVYNAITTGGGGGMYSWMPLNVVNWGCSSSTNSNEQALIISVGAGGAFGPSGTLPSQYAPSICT